MKSIVFFCTLALLCVIFSAQAQTYELRDWNRGVVTKVNNRNASVGRRFTDRNQVVFQGANRSSGWIYAVEVGKNEGVVVRGCAGSNSCTVAQRVVGGTHHELNTMKIEDILALADQQAITTLQTTTTVQKTEMLQKSNNADLQKAKTNNADLQKVNTTKVVTPNANLNKAKATQVRQ